MIHSSFRLLTAAALTALAMASSVKAEELPAPEGTVLLTISGDIENTNGDGIAEFDIDMLRAIGETEITTETIWTPGTKVFKGVPLSTLLEYVGADGETIDATAINDYSIAIPMSDAVPTGPIIAYEMDGELMSRRDKGPLWVIYPFSSSSEYRTEVIYSRSIWQLDRLAIK
ncbi:oxidoreductase, molybdopterin binding [Citreicella sp. SE45]|nr:oxidoreductase, molybdopterin binding [Citreicella sp. SE45]